jgi:hypothetical protein
LVLVVLAAVWAAVLIPPALRRRSEGRPSDSITHFRRQLAILRRTGPRSSRIGANDHWSRSYAPYAPPPQLASVSHLNAARARRNGTAMGPPSSRSYASAARSRTLRRRRDVFTVLLAAAAGTLVLGLLPPLRFLWMVHLVIDVLLIAYVALLIQQRNAAAARDINVRFLPSTGFDPSLMPGEPAMLRRSAN